MTDCQADSDPIAYTSATSGCDLEGVVSLPNFTTPPLTCNDCDERNDCDDCGERNDCNDYNKMQQVAPRLAPRLCRAPWLPGDHAA